MATLVLIASSFYNLVVMFLFICEIIFETLFAIAICFKNMIENQTFVADISNDITSKFIDDNMDLPNIYVNDNFMPKQNESPFCLNNNNKKPIFDKIYEINGFIYQDEPVKDEIIFEEFEIRNDNENITIVTTEGNARCNDMSRDHEQDILIQETPYGILINSNILVPENHWHAIVSEWYVKKCFVCDMTVKKPEDHKKLDTHLDNLDKHKPLIKNVSDITRQIGCNYHCVICNDIINISNIDEHIGSKYHEDKMVDSMNRAQYALCDYNIHIDRDILNGSDATNERLDGFYDYEKSDIDSVDVCSKKELYATIVKGPAKLHIDLDDRDFRIKKDSWHMIFPLGQNKFYCMVCVCDDDIANKTEHYEDKVHLEKLSKCTVVAEYTEHFIRKVNDKFYHCGDCNSLQYIPCIDDHIKFAHNANKLKQDKTQNEKKKKKGTRNLNNIYMKHESNENQMCMNQSTSLILKNKYIDIHQFQHLLRVSFISYNFVCQRPNDYFCGICNFVASEFDMATHINEVNHIENVKGVPYQVIFGINLIRFIDKSAHCSLCNVVFHAPLVYAHILDQKHVTLRNKAILEIPNNINVPKGPENTNQRVNESTTSMNQAKIVKIDVIDSTENQTRLESYNGYYVYLKFKNTYNKVTFKSYNSLMTIGDGSHYCFVCSIRVFGSWQEHMETGGHANVLEKCSFVNKYDKHLLRQVSSAYHCCNCNIMFAKSELQAHMAWPVEMKTDKKTRKIDFKSGVKQIIVETKPESIVSDEKSMVEVLLRIDIKRANSDFKIKKCNKFIIFNDSAVKVSWDAWQGLVRNKNGYRCVLCQLDLKVYNTNTHISDDKHEILLESSIDKMFLPSLLRRINGSLLHCVTCNMEVSSKSHLVTEHIKGKKHKNSHNIINQLDINKLNTQDLIYI